MDPINLLAMMQAAQGAQSAPTMAGPVAPQQLAPGFRAPPQMSMRAPPQQQGFDPSQAMGMFGGLMGRAKPAGWVPSTSGSEPGRTAGDADLGGYGGQPENPFGNPNATPTVFNSQDPHEQAIQQALSQAYAQNNPTLGQRVGNFFRGLF